MAARGHRWGERWRADGPGPPSRARHSREADSSAWRPQRDGDVGGAKASGSVARVRGETPRLARRGRRVACGCNPHMVWARARWCRGGRGVGSAWTRASG
jgi:hypothetical protein